MTASRDAEPDLPRTCDVIIAGGGLAGLAAALHLQRAGLDAIVLEAGDDVGGRVRTDDIDGIKYPIDRGFQVYNPAYPEAQRLLDNAALDLASFVPGVLVRFGPSLWRLGDPRHMPGWAFSGFRAPIGSPLTKARLGMYARHVGYGDVRTLESASDVSMLTALLDAGLTGPIVERVLRPFLSGVFLEPDLNTSRRFGDLAFRSFVRGTPGIPRKGMRAIPRQLAARLNASSLFTNVRVTAITGDGVETSRGPVAAPSVIVACDPVSAAGLLELPQPSMNSVTTWYHVADVSTGELAEGLAVITIDGDNSGPITNSYVASNLFGDKTGEGQLLVASSAIGVHSDAATERAARDQLARMYGVSTKLWELAACYPIAHALPAMLPPFQLRKSVRIGLGRYVAGDHRDTSSIQGALVSGRRAARAVLKDRDVVSNEEGRQA